MTSTGRNKNKAVRVLMCHPSGDLFGSDRMFLETANALASSGYHLRIMLSEDGPLRLRLKEVGLEVSLSRVPRMQKSKLNFYGIFAFLMLSFLSLFECSWQIIRFRPAVIWVNTITIPSWLIVAKLFMKSTVCHVREAENELTPLIRKIIVSPLICADFILCNSKYTEQFVLSNINLGKWQKTKVVYNGKDWAPYDCGVKELDLVNSVKLVVVGRLSPRKGQDTAIRALGRLREDGIKAYLTLVGDPFESYSWYKTELESLVSDLGLIEFCSFAGFQNEVSGFFRETDIAIVPSRIEPFGTVALESIAANRLTIVSNAGGLPESVCNKDELIFRAGEDKDLADKIQFFVSNPLLARDVTAECKARLEDHFSQNTYRENIVNVMREVSVR